jgi:hypothetical protein
MEKIKEANKPIVEKPNQGIEDKLAELKAKFGK